jgi:hypothetical protein
MIVTRALLNPMKIKFSYLVLLAEESACRHVLNSLALEFPRSDMIQLGTELIRRWFQSYALSNDQIGHEANRIHAFKFS